MCCRGTLITILLAVIRTTAGAAGRDLLLIPKKVLQVQGKSIYYDPHENGSIVDITWEQTLKHVSYLTLFMEPNGESDPRNVESYRDFMRSPFIRMEWEYPKFGDIITIARGHIEKSNIEYRFVEGSCEPYCSQQVIALWKVQKIRHRDERRGFRYELKFSITPLGNDIIGSTDLATKERYFKSFVLRDDDYPSSFNTLTRRSDDFGSSNERQSRIVNEIPKTRNELLSQLPPLNIGEYIKHPVAASKVGYTSNIPFYPMATTYKPKSYGLFNKSHSFEDSTDPKTIVTHHFHHHFFMTDSEIPIPQGDKFITGNSDAIRIVKGPNAKLFDPRYTSTIYTTSTMAPPSPIKLNIPIYVQSVPLPDPQKKDLNKFKQSEQHVDNIRYSEPDPLYENKGTLTSSLEFTPPVLYSQIERPSSSYFNTTVSGSTQLPSLTDDQVVEASYVEKEQNSTTLPTIAPITSSSTSFLSPTKSAPPIKNKVSRTTPMPRIQSGRQFFKNRITTEQPILKWKPKQKFKPIFTDDTNLYITTTQSPTEEEVITVTPSYNATTEFEVLTRRSVSKSISVKVGNCSKETPLAVVEEMILLSKKINSNEN